MIARWVAHELIPGELALHLDAAPVPARARVLASIDPKKTEAASVWQAQRAAQQRLLVSLKEEAARAAASLVALEDLEKEAATYDHKHR